MNSLTYLHCTRKDRVRVSSAAVPCHDWSGLKWLATVVCWPQPHPAVAAICHLGRQMPARINFIKTNFKYTV